MPNLTQPELDIIAQHDLALLARMPIDNAALSRDELYTIARLIKRDLLRRRIQDKRIVWERKVQV